MMPVYLLLIRGICLVRLPQFIALPCRVMDVMRYLRFADKQNIIMVIKLCDVKTPKPVRRRFYFPGNWLQLLPTRVVCFSLLACMLAFRSPAFACQFTKWALSSFLWSSLRLVIARWSWWVGLFNIRVNVAIDLGTLVSSLCVLNVHISSGQPNSSESRARESPI